MQAVLRDYRSGKAKSATELSKMHGVSRSAVYRLLKKEAEQPQDPKEEAKEKEQDNDEGETGNLMEDLYTKAEQFANSLGLPEQSGKVVNEVKDHKAEQEKEEKLDAFMDAVMGNTPSNFSLPVGLEAALQPPSPTVLRRIDDTPPPPQYNEAKRAEITQKIIFNVQHFGPQLEVITGPNKEAFLHSLATFSTPQLSETLNTLERTRSVGNIANGFKHLFYVAGQATETATQIIGMSTNGFTQQLRSQDEEITMIMKEIAIEQWERLKVMDSPQVRLGMIFTMTLIQVDTRNKIDAHFKRAPVPEHIAAKSSDL